MARPRLFVRSKEANLVVGYSFTKTEYKLSPMDAQAKVILTKKAIDFELVDLSRTESGPDSKSSRDRRNTNSASRDRPRQETRRVESHY